MAKYAMGMAEKQELPEPKYPMKQWGRDHWSTFAYIEGICVDYPDKIGKPDHRKIQCNANRHPWPGQPAIHNIITDVLKFKTMRGMPDF